MYVFTKIKKFLRDIEVYRFPNIYNNFLINFVMVSNE